MIIQVLQSTPFRSLMSLDEQGLAEERRLPDVRLESDRNLVSVFHICYQDHFLVADS